AEHAEIAENYFDADVTVPEKYSSAISAISAVTFPRTSISPILVDVILLDGSSLTIEQLIAIADRGEPIALSDVARERVRASRAVVERRARRDEPAYGIHTGFGSFADVKIAPDALEALQLNLLRSHAAGVGDPLPPRAVRATMALRANVL